MEFCTSSSNLFSDVPGLGSVGRNNPISGLRIRQTAAAMQELVEQWHRPGHHQRRGAEPCDRQLQALLPKDHRLDPSQRRHNHSQRQSRW